MRSFYFPVAAATLVATCSPAFAALPPNHQRLAELSAVLSDPAVVGAFEVSEPIDRVEYIRPDLYRVSAGSCHIYVAIADKPGRPGIVGPRQFEVKPGKKICP